MFYIVKFKAIMEFLTLSEAKYSSCAGLYVTHAHHTHVFMALWAPAGRLAPALLDCIGQVKLNKQTKRKCK